MGSSGPAVPSWAVQGRCARGRSDVCVEMGVQGRGGWAELRLGLSKTLRLRTSRELISGNCLRPEQGCAIPLTVAVDGCVS